MLSYYNDTINIVLNSHLSKRNFGKGLIKIENKNFKQDLTKL